MRQLLADGLNVAKIADLLHLPVPQVRQYITRARSTNGGAGAAASTGTAAPETDQAG